MVNQSGSVFSTVARAYEDTGTTRAPIETNLAEPLPDGDGDGPRWPSRRVMLLLAGWIGLVLAVAGANLASSSFWFSSAGVALVAFIVLPVAGVLAAQGLNDRLAELRQQSDELRVALARFVEPEPVTSGNIVSIRHAVHRELTSFNEQLDRSLDRTSEIESVIRREVETLEQTFADNERRMLGLVQELARQRETVLSATEQVRDVVKASRDGLASELASLSSQVLEAGNYARGIVEEVGNELRTEMNARGEGLAEHMRHVIDSQVRPFGELLTDQVQTIDTLLSEGNGRLVDMLKNHGAGLVEQLDTAWVKISDDIAGRTKAAEDVALRLTNVMDESLESNLNRLENTIKSTSLEILGVLDNAANEAAQKISEVSATTTDAFDQRVASLHQQIDVRLQDFGNLMHNVAAQFVPALEQQSGTLKKAIELGEAVEQGTARLSSVLSEQASSFVDHLAQSLGDFQTQLSAQSGSISDELLNKLDRMVVGLEDGTRRFETTLVSVQDTISLASDRLAVAVSGYNADFAQSVEQLGSVVAEGSERIDEQFSRGLSQLADVFGGGSRGLETSLDAWSGRLGEILAGGSGQIEVTGRAQLTYLESVQAEHNQKLREIFTSGSQSLAELLSSGSEILTEACETAQGGMTEIAMHFGKSLSDSSASFATRIDGFVVAAGTSLVAAANDGLTQLDAHVGELNESLHAGLQPIYDGITVRTREFEASISQFGSDIDAQTSRLNKVMTQRSQSIAENLEEGVDRVEQTMKGFLARTDATVSTFARDEAQQFDGHIEALTRALAEQGEAADNRMKVVSGMLETRGRELRTTIEQFSAGAESQVSRLREAIDTEERAIEHNVDTSVAAIEKHLAAYLKQAQGLLREFVDEEGATFDRHVDVLSRTLDSRSELLDSIMRTRGKDFGDKLYTSSKQFEEGLAAATRSLDVTLRSGTADLQERMASHVTGLHTALKGTLQTALEGVSEQSAQIDTRLIGVSRDVRDALDGTAANVAQMLDTQVATVRQVLHSGGDIVGSALARESQRLTEVLNENATGLTQLVQTRTAELESSVRAQTAALAAAIDDGTERVGVTVELATRSLEQTVSKETAAAKGALEKATETATRMLAGGLESARQQISGSVDKLLQRLATHEKSATNRMEEAAATVGENTRKAAELTAERLVTLNGALVQVLSSLGTRPARKTRPEVVPDAAE